jgi:hypothetical protein
MRGVDESSGRKGLALFWVEGWSRTDFCLKYNRELSTAAMPCRHCKYDDDMRGIDLGRKEQRCKYRSDNNWDTHVACERTKGTGHLLKIVARIVLGRHREWSWGGGWGVG